MRIQAQDVEDVIKVSAAKKKKAKPITKDKKAEQKNDEKKSPARKKVKMRKRKQREKEDDLSHQLRAEQEVPELKNENMRNQSHANTWSELLRRKVKGKTNRASRTSRCRQRLVLGTKFMVCISFI